MDYLANCEFEAISITDRLFPLEQIMNLKKLLFIVKLHTETVVYRDVCYFWQSKKNEDEEKTHSDGNLR